MTSQEQLSSPARLAWMTLREHSSLRTPSAIANGPYSVSQIDTEDIARALVELEGFGLAERVGGGWRLTAGGRTLS